ncbi:tetratricopeptide repeat protein [Neptunomonas japonica]|uniref:tetratricopeptide repeat protein n=1 Tax=Neptunomonas japonica TaxID=417574 RepID=UPI00040FD071|nr:tetratricopeptide repeat protein [Neptunomonas japonica]
MSLVNDMLRDLDERKRDGSVNHRPVAKPKRSIGRWIWIALATLIIAAVVYFVAIELRGKVGERADLLSWLKQETQAADSVNSSSVPLAVKSDVVQKESEANSAKPETVASESSSPIVTDINLINWTTKTQTSGYLTFWMGQVKPFVLYEKTANSLDIAIDESRLVTGLPDMDSLLISAVEIIAEEGKSRFKLTASGPVEFKTQLKKNPARLVVSVNAPVEASSNTVVSAQKATVEAMPDTPALAASESAPKKPDVVSIDTQESAVSYAEPAAPTMPSQPEGQWRKSLNTLPTDSSTVRSARRLLSQQRTEEAVSLLTGYIEKAPASLQSQYLLVQLYLATERYSRATALLEKAPNNLSWSLLKARSLLQQGQANEAIRLLEQYPDGQSREDYLDLLASGYQQVGQHGAAVARYLSLLGLNPQEARWWINLGVSLEHLGQNSKALDAYQTALQIPNLDRSLKQYARQQSQRLLQLQ